MSGEWLEEAIERMEEKNIITPALTDELQAAIDTGQTQKSLVVVKNTEKGGRTIRPSLEGLEFDNVDIIQIGEAVQ